MFLQITTPADITDLSQVITYLLGGGMAVVVSYLFAMLAEVWPRWHTFPFAVKYLVPWIVSVGLTLVTAWIASHPDWIAAAAPTFALIMVSSLSYIATQKSYKSNKKMPTEG